VLFTHPLLTLLARTKFFGQGHRWSGLDPKSLGSGTPIGRRSRPSWSTRTLPTSRERSGSSISPTR